MLLSAIGGRKLGTTALAIYNTDNKAIISKKGTTRKITVDLKKKMMT